MAYTDDGYLILEPQKILSGAEKSNRDRARAAGIDTNSPLSSIEIDQALRHGTNTPFSSAEFWFSVPESE